MAGFDGPAEPPVRSSPRLHHASLPPSSSPASSSVVPPLSPPRRHTKQKKPPSITPRKFNAFFARRSTRSRTASGSVDETARALEAITGAAINGRQRAVKDSPIPFKQPLHRSTRPAFRDQDENDEENRLETPRQAKRRKTGHHTPPESSPLKPPPLLQSSPCARTSERIAGARSNLLSPLQSLPPSSQVTDDISDFECDTDADNDDMDGVKVGHERGPQSDEEDGEEGREPPRRLTQLPQRGMAAHLLQRQLGTMPRPGRSFLPTPLSDWRSETAGFHSGPEDIHYTTSHDGNARCIPFCAAACNTNSLVAVGDEEGRVRLLDTNPSASFDKIHLCFQSHNNAIIDLAFSSDDTRLATASGDQTGKVIDMMTQVPISILGQHTASLKQVRFQPGRGEGHVLATSSRDGSIQIWDLRCHGGPVSDSITLERDAGLRYTTPRNIASGAAVNSFFGAHEAMPRHQTRSVGLSSNPLGTTTTDHADVASRGEVPGRLSDVSVTAIHWLPAGREHLLLSACEADASIKLWDIRAIHTSRSHRTPVPVGYTAPPTSHTNWRHFGISSLSLSTDSSRLYALCKDNTVYAYSTSHMVVGPPPSESSTSSSFASTKKPKHAPAEQLPGPLYGFRHNNFHATSFYIKSSLRPLQHGRSELLAVGSADGSPVLFPTDERYFQRAIDAGRLNSQQNNPDATFTTTTMGLKTATANAASAGRSRMGAHSYSSSSSTAAAAAAAAAAALRRPTLARTCSSSFSQGLRASIRDDIPIIRTVNDVTYGAPLARGHGKEVGALAWSSEGSLVTVSDDYLIRCWREQDGGVKARDLRVRGEGEGRRWGCGWADVQEGWDDDE